MERLDLVHSLQRTFYESQFAAELGGFGRP